MASKEIKVGRQRGVAVMVRLPPELAEAIEAYREGVRPHPTMTGVVVTALEDFLAAKERWPAKGEE